MGVYNETATGGLFGQSMEVSSSGTGFLISSDGELLTNYHVIQGASRLTVVLYSGAAYEARVLGYEAESDIALLKIDASGLPTVTLGDSDSLYVGAEVAAVGNPLGELTYSPEKAREILDAAGYLDVDGDGYREDPQGNAMDVLITPQYNTSRQELLARLAAILADNLAKVGIKTTLDEESMTSREAWSARAENGGTYQLYLGYCTSGIASYIGAPMYIVNYTETGWWGTWQDQEYLDAYHAVKAVNNFDDYKAAMRELQRIISEQLPAISFAFGTSSFPYRTDRYEGWINYPGWGVINNKTWYQTVTK